MNRKKLLLALLGTFALGGIAATQLDQLIKIGGVAAVVNNFGKDMNKGINGLTGHRDTSRMKTKVVTILSVGLGRSSAIGAAQVMGPPSLVDKVAAVAQPEADLLGGTIRLKALIPVSSKDVIKSIRKVDGVAVTGIIDIKL